MKQMRLGRARDMSGIVLEMFKLDCEPLHSMILEVFNDVLRPDAEPPCDWRCSRLVVIFKKGDHKLPSNYRPIAILSVLYKLFSRWPAVGRLSSLQKGVQHRGPLVEHDATAREVL